MKKYHHLIQEQRYTIAQMLKQGAGVRDIATVLDVSPSTISRELRRNGQPSGYQYKIAQRLAEERQCHRCTSRVLSPAMRAFIHKHIQEYQWSPEQISGYCKLNGIPMVGKTTIYTYLHDDKWTGGTLYKYCRHQMKRRVRTKPSSCWQQSNRKKIDERPEQINQKLRMGDFEMDTIVGANGKEAILTLVDRLTGFSIIELLPQGHKAKALSRAVVKRLSYLKRRGQLHSITTDNGTEFSDFGFIEKKLNIPVFFAKPYCSTDKPHIEYLNTLIRQYLPKGTSFRELTTSNISAIEARLNGRPRRNLGFLTPLQAFLLRMNV